MAQPVSIMVNTYGTGVISDADLAQIISEVFDLRPHAIIEALDLRKPIYRQRRHGHLGREELNVSWKTGRSINFGPPQHATRPGGHALGNEV